MIITKELIENAKKVEEFKQQLAKLCLEYDLSLITREEIYVRKNNEYYELSGTWGKFPKE